MAFSLIKGGKPAVAAAYSQERTIVAAAQRINIADKTEAERSRTRAAVSHVWQTEAWVYYDEIGEVKYAFNLIGNVMSRIRLYVGVVTDPHSAPAAVEDAVVDPDDTNDGSLADDASEARRESAIDPKLAKQAGDAYKKQMGRSNVASMLRNSALNLSVAGECLFVLEGDVWTARSTDEIKIAAGMNRFQVRRSRAEGVGSRFLKDGSTVGRVWRQHPQFSMDPDSSMLGVRSSCEELLLLSRMIRAAARSRLNAGMLFVPDEISATARTSPDDGSLESEAEGDPFETELLYATTDPITNENSGAGIVPMLLRGPGEFGDKIKYLTFERKTDQFLVERADKALDRVVQGLDVPKDVVSGMAHVKYTNAVQIEEAMYKAHVEPLALMIADAFTDIILRPTLMAGGMTPEEAHQFVVWYDPSEIVIQPNRTEDASTGYDKFTLSGAAWRDAHGWSDTDAPDEEEIAFRLAMGATIPPEIATVLFQKLMPSLMAAAKAAAAADAKPPPELDQLLNSSDAASPPVAETSTPQGATP